MLWRTGAFPAMKQGGAVGYASPLLSGRHDWDLSVSHPFYTFWSLFFIGCTKAIKLIK
jgi:hypothetical protein